MSLEAVYETRHENGAVELVATPARRVAPRLLGEADSLARAGG